MQTVSGSSESQARRNSALASALFPIADFLADNRVVEVMANADGAVWVDRLGEGLLPHLRGKRLLCQATFATDLGDATAHVMDELLGIVASHKGRRSRRQP
jgi:hypothetical protein